MSAEVEAAVANPTTDTTQNDRVESNEPAPEVKEVDADVEDNAEQRNDAEKLDDKGDDKYNSKKRDYDGDRKYSKNQNYRNGDRKYNNYNQPYDRKRNIKSRYDKQEESSDPVAIRKQVEFYFSDHNLRQDKYLFEKVGGAENNPVEIKTITSFKRMQRFQPYTAIVDALRESTTLNVVDGRESGAECVQRKEPLPKDIGTDHAVVSANYQTSSMKRSIYAKGFGNEKETTQLDIEEFFQPYGAVSVRLRRHNDGFFKGSVFVEFSTEDEAKQFLELEGKPEFIEGKELLVKSKTEYCEQKEKEINEGKIRRNDLSDREDNGGRNGYRGGRGFGRGRGRGGRGNYNDRDRNGPRGQNRRRDRSRSGSRDLRNDDWKERRARDQERDRDGKRREKNGEDEAEKGPVQEYDEVGIPKVISTESKTETNGKKRAAEDNLESTAEKKAKE